MRLLSRPFPGSPRNKLTKDYFNKLQNRSFLRWGNESLLPSKRSTFNLHLSNQGGAIPHSHHTTLNICMYGAKRWLIVNASDFPDDNARAHFEQIDKMVEQKSKKVLKNYSSQDWFRKEAAELLEKLGVPYYDFVQEQGDAVFIPDFWTHATMDLCRETVGVAIM